MYWSRTTVLFGPDSYDNQHYKNVTPPWWNDEVNYTAPDTLLSNRQTLNPSWALYVVLATQPILLSLALLASFIVRHFSNLDASNFGIVAVLAGVRPESLKLFDGASVSGTLTRPVGVRIDPIPPTTTESAKQQPPRIEYSFFRDDDDDGCRPQKPSTITTTLRHRFHTGGGKEIGYHRID